ncbi:hypothetical protein JTB14_009372 [Gonioctena quinquepunctata]|nr:hypothetical protein JTB14_009372 [Gonioctena quinquepunctata]
MFQVTIDDMLLTVDEETAEQLRGNHFNNFIPLEITSEIFSCLPSQQLIFIIISDPEYAENYATAVRRELLNQDTRSTPHQPNEKSRLWKSSECPTEDDHKATCLLALRRSYDAEFSDKKTHKNVIWTKIDNKMNETGFYVGEGVDARERVRQKFSNLQSTYIKYRDSQKRTGEGKLKVPKYLDELEDILGFKHEVNPILVIDSTLPSNYVHENGESSETSCKGIAQNMKVHLPIDSMPLRRLFDPNLKNKKLSKNWFRYKGRIRR